MLNLTVFCSSKNDIDSNFYVQSEKLIKLLNYQNITIVYGGGTNGLMGHIRKIFVGLGGKVISSNIKKYTEEGIHDDYLYDNIDERQQKLVELGDAYLVLPGGYGTCFEMLEVMTKNDIGEQSKPIFIFNCNGIFNNLIRTLDDLRNNGFISRNLNQIKVFVSDNAVELAARINNLLVWFYDITSDTFYM